MQTILACIGVCGYQGGVYWLVLYQTSIIIASYHGKYKD